MKTQALLLAVSALCFSSMGFGEESGQAPVTRTEQHALVRTAFGYDPKIREELLAKNPEALSSQAATADGVVMMAPMTVQESFKWQSLETAMKRDEEMKDAMKVKLGTGLLSAKTGKFRFFAATALYVPVFVGVTIDF